jgi:hypothetical protein
VAPYAQQYQVTRLAGTPVPKSYQVLWQAADGQPVLARQAIGRGAAYQFYSRLHPAWSSLADSPNLPLLLLSLLQPEPAMADARDNRQLDPTQVMAPGPRPAAARAVAPTPADTDLRVWLLVAGALLWVLERVVAMRLSSPKATVA